MASINYNFCSTKETQLSVYFAFGLSVANFDRRPIQQLTFPVGSVEEKEFAVTVSESDAKYLFNGKCIRNAQSQSVNEQGSLTFYRIFRKHNAAHISRHILRIMTVAAIIALSKHFYSIFNRTLKKWTKIAFISLFRPTKINRTLNQC